MAFKSGFNWEEIIEDFRRGDTNTQICAKHGISDAGLIKGLRKRGITRTSEGVVRRRAIEKADEQSLRDAKVPVNIARIEALSEMAAGVLTRHRRQTGETQEILTELKQRIRYALTELPQVEESIVEYYAAQAANNPLAAGAIRQRMQAALACVSLGSLSKAFANAASIEKTVIELERKAYKLDEDTPNEKSYEDHLKELHDIAQARKKQLIQEREVATQT